MATWTTLPDSTIEPGKPIRSIDTLALRDNPIAIAEGEVGAPKILDSALGATVTTAGTNWVQNRIAGGAVGAVGTYAFLGEIFGVTSQPGSTRAGSNLRYAGVMSSSQWIATTASALAAGVSTPVPSGTWRCMGYSQFVSQGENQYYGGTLWLRIA